MDNPATPVVYALFQETSSSDSENEDDNLLLHSSAALIDRRLIPEIGSFYDIITTGVSKWACTRYFYPPEIVYSTGRNY